VDLEGLVGDLEDDGSTLVIRFALKTSWIAVRRIAKAPSGVAVIAGSNEAGPPKRLWRE
jgi:hypothetical protein